MKKRITQKKLEERRAKLEELAKQPAKEAEESILPTVTDIYSHPNFLRRRKGDGPDGAQGKHV